MLVKEQFEKAVSFIENYARDLDKAVLEYEFGDGKKGDVIWQLSQFQNEDGGFGNALEPDIHLKSSSVIVTTVAFQYMDWIDINPDHKLVKEGISYLLQNMENDGNMVYWSFSGLDINDEPHAPWWSIEKISPPKLTDWPNPNAEIIGYLNRYKKLVPEENLSQANRTLSHHLEQVPYMKEFSWFNYLCWKRSLPHLPAELLSKVFNMLDLSFSDHGGLEEMNLEIVHIQDIVTEKSSYLYEKYPVTVEKLLRENVQHQQEDGGWYPSWSWGDDQLWDKVRMEWAGKITLELLMTLKYMDMIDTN